MIKILKQALLSVILLGLALSAGAQDSFVTWTTKVKGLGGDLYEVVFHADIEKSWHLYDLGPYDEYGPNPTVFTFEPSQGVKLEGPVYLITPSIREYEEMFGMEIGYFEEKAEFGQKVRLTAPKGTLKGMVEWMVCNDTSCVPPDDMEFSVEIVGNPAAVPAVTAGSQPQAPAVTEPDVQVAGSDMQTVSPVVEETTVAVEEAIAAKPVADAASSGKSLWGLIIEAILWGFAMLLTPCVFPMVPMTVSFFMKGEGGARAGRIKALTYGIFIVLLYTLPIAAIILITRIVGGDAVTADIFNWLATHWLPNVIFFIVFMLFAASFFGAFEITMPSKLVNKSDSKADKKGIVGIFFMALTLVLVSFSCTGPIVGSVLIKSISGEFWTPIITMFAFSCAFALPFTIFALFPSMLKNLPKSGGWLNSVKVVLGFIELALGLKFLSVADQTYHWGILDREIYLALWIVIFALLGMYLLGKIKFKYDSDLKHVGVGRLVLAILSFSFVVYLLPGMWGAPLKGLSGYMPPMTSQDFVLGQGGSATVSSGEATSSILIDGKQPKYSDFLHLPLNIKGFFDYNEALAYSKKVGKPIFVDFTGHGCVNCREMEARVWSDPAVLDILNNDYVVLALYADDKKVLPEEDWVTTSGGKVLKSLGKINSNFARERFGVNAQPYYMLLDNNGELLIDPRGYNLDVTEFVKFLKTGVDNYKSGNR